MLRVPVTFSLFFISVPDPEDHPLMRDSDLHKFRPLGLETHPCIEPDRGGLRVQMNLRESERPCQNHQGADHRAADPGAAVLREYCDATDLTGGVGAGCGATGPLRRARAALHHPATAHG